MPRKLTDTRIKSLKPRKKSYKIFDSNGLYIEIRPSGKKIWRVKYKINKKDKTVTLGEYPLITLLEARKRAIEIKAGLKKNNPVVIKTFREVADEFLKVKKNEWSKKHFNDQIAKLRNYVFNFIGTKQVVDITKQDINLLLDHVLNTHIPHSNNRGSKTELRRKIFILVRQILRYALNRDYIKHNVCDSIDLKEILPNTKPTHIKAITDEDEFLNLVKTLFEMDGVFKTTHLALKFLILTALRSANVRYMQWHWVNYDNKIITIPAEEMKTRKEFRLPLTKTLLGIIKEAEKIKKGKYIFYSPANSTRPLSENVFLVLLKRLGIENHKPHGFRSSFSTFCYEKQKEHGLSAEVIETQLAHSIGTQVTRAYMRSDFLEERKELLEWWENFLKIS